MLVVRKFNPFFQPCQTVNNECNWFEGVNTYTREGINIILWRKITISQELNISWTSDQSVNSSLSPYVQKKKYDCSICLGLIMAARKKFKSTFFLYSKIEIYHNFADFQQKSRTSWGWDRPSSAQAGFWLWLNLICIEFFYIWLGIICVRLDWEDLVWNILLIVDFV